MEIDIQAAEKALVAAVRGRVDTVSAGPFEKGLAEALAGDATRLVLDFTDLEYISSAGLRVVLKAGKILKAKGGEVRLAALRPSVQKVFEISGFLSIFKTFDTRRAAIEGA